VKNRVCCGGVGGKGGCESKLERGKVLGQSAGKGTAHQGGGGLGEGVGGDGGPGYNARMEPAGEQGGPPRWGSDQLLPAAQTKKRKLLLP